MLLEALIQATLDQADTDIEAIAGVERVPGDRAFWYVRMVGDTKANFSAEFTLDQRTLTVESYFMADPEENRQALFEQLLVRNRSMNPLQFCIGKDRAVYLRAQIDNRYVDAETVDRLLASVYEYTEAYFVTAMRIGFESRFKAGGRE